MSGLSVLLVKESRNKCPVNKISSSIFVNIVISLVNKNIVANDHLLLDYHRIKGTFLADFFTQSKPAWVDDLGTRKLILFFYAWGLFLPSS